MNLKTTPVVQGTPEQRQVFWSYVAKGDGCWNWTRTRLKGGTWYGQCKMKPWRGLVAHRVAYTLTKGPIPEGLFVMHLCDKPGVLPA